MSAMPLAQLKFINQLTLETAAGSPAFESCVSETPQPDLSGSKVRIPGDDTIYVVDRRGYRRRIPFPLTFVNLFKDSAFRSMLVYRAVAEIAEGPALDDDALLLRGAASEKVYLLDGGRKRLIGGRSVMEKYGFNEAAVAVIPQAVVDSVPTGEIWE